LIGEVRSGKDHLVAPEAVERASSRFPSFEWCFETPVLNDQARLGQLPLAVGLAI